MRAVIFTAAGGNEVVQLVERPDPVPGPEEVLVAVGFAGLNPADLQQRAGRYPAPPGNPPDHPGLEVAGTVIAMGEKVTTWREGDRVFGLIAAGGLADRVVVHERCVARVPDTLADREAAAVPEGFITAHDAVMTQAGLRMGEVLLVHGAAGGVGSAAVQIGIEAGCRVVATARSDRAREAVTELGAEVFDDEAFPGNVRASTRRPEAWTWCSSWSARRTWPATSRCWLAAVASPSSAWAQGTTSSSTCWL